MLSKDFNANLDGLEMAQWGRVKTWVRMSSTHVKSMAVYAYNPSFAGFRQADPQSLLASQPT